MSDLRFLKELGAEFERIGETHASARRSDRGRRRWMRVPRSAVAGVGLGLSVLVVVGVVVVAFGVHASSPTGSSGPGHGIRIVFRATARDPRSPLGPAIDRSVGILRHRLGTVFHDVQVSRAGNRIVVVAPDASRSDRARIERLALGSPARLEFYDWEANALTPNGKTVASQLQAQDPQALAISQGVSFAAPGQPNAGGLPLYEAVKLAARQPKRVSPSNARLGPQYYMFGASGSAACAAKARQEGIVPTAGQHCLLAGPDNEPYSTSYDHSVQNLAGQLPPGVSASDGQVLVVPQGTVVLRAANPSAGQQTKLWSPKARFFVLRDNVAVPGADITNPQPSTDSSGSPDIKFGFNAKGNAAFEKVTRSIAHRGQDVSTLGQRLNQHFAIALDNQLLTVPSIDYQVYPDGIPGGNGADITGGFTVQSARNIAMTLRYRPLPVRLTVG